MRKHCLLWLLICCLAAAIWPGGTANAESAASVWNGTAATDFAGGRGTQEKPYLIETAAQLAYLAQSVNAGKAYNGQYISLEADLNLSRLPWTPIGTEANSFLGTFLGNAHTISNLYINAPSADYQGLFGHFDNGTIQNLCLRDISVNGNQYVGGLCGRGGAIKECNISGAVSGAKFVGGISGFDDSGSISNCVNNADVVANGDYAGGVSGYFSNHGSIYTITQCLNTGSVNANGACVGGIAGDAKGDIYRSINAGSVGGEYATNAGGIAGRVSYGSRLRNCANLGAVTAKNGAYAGGIVALSGYNDGQSYRSSIAYVENCYNAGIVTSSAAGSIAGSGELRDSANNLYFTYCYALTGTADELVYDYNGTNSDSVTWMDELNTAAFLQTLNHNLDTTQNGVWIRNSYIYDGYPYFEPRTISSIAVTTPPNRTFYAPGETFDPDGMIVEGKCTDGSNYPLSLDALTFFPTTPLTEETDSVSVFYGSMSATCAITVSIEALSEYTIENLSVKDSIGNSLSSIPQGRFLAVIEVKRNRPVDSGIVILASYTAAGQFRGLLYQQVNKPVGETTYLTLPIDNASGTIGQVKAFVIHSFDDWRPLATPLSFPAA